MEFKKTQMTKENISVMLKEAGKTRQAEVIKKALPAFALALASFAVCGVETLFGVFPFGFALLCACSGFVMTSASLIGCVIAASAMENGVFTICTLCAVYLIRLGVSYFTVHNFTIGKAFYEPLTLRLASSVAASAAVSLSLAGSAESTLMVIVPTAFALCAFPLFTASFVFAREPSVKRPLRLAGLMGALVCAGATVTSFALPFDLSAVFAFFLAVAVTYKNGPAMGSAAGVCMALAGEPVFTPLYVLAAFTSALLFDISRSAAVVAAAVCGIGWSLYAGGLSGLSSVLPEVIFAAAAAAPLISCNIISRKPLFADKVEDEKRNEAAEDRIGKISESFEGISKLLYSLSDRMACPDVSEAERICSGSRGKFCSGCLLGCPEKEADSFFKGAVHSLVSSGRAGADLAPEGLARRCHNIDAILDNINTSAKIHAKMSDAGRKTQLFAGDYKAVAELLREVADPGGSSFARDTEAEKRLYQELRAEGIRAVGVSVYGMRNRRVYVRGISMPLEAGEDDIRVLCEGILGCRLSSPEFSIDGGSVSLSMKSVLKISIDYGKFVSPYPGEKYSGDTALTFTNEEGYAYSLVSDGMGSGREAALTSGISGVYLEKLLSAGCPMKSALQLLNAFICGGENECFATIDIMEADLYTGRASFIKSGAAPSFVLRDGKVFRLHSKTVPIGIIRALDAEMIKLELRRGDMVIMMSDGVTGSYENCPWLYELLQSGELSGCSPRVAARVIGEAAIKASQERDDITVCAMKVS